MPLNSFWVIDTGIAGHGVNFTRVSLLMNAVFIYAHNYLLHMGFYNFALSMSMFFFTLGYWWKHRDEMNPANIAIDDA